MELLADRDPEEARNLLDAVLERMMEAVHRYEGTHAIAWALSAAHHGTGRRAEGVVLMEEAARGAGPAPAPGPLSRPGQAALRVCSGSGGWDPFAGPACHRAHEPLDLGLVVVVMNARAHEGLEAARG